MNNNITTVLDIGSLFVKFGISGQEAPKHQFPNHVGVFQDDRILYDALQKPIHANITQPFKNGYI